MPKSNTLDTEVFSVSQLNRRVKSLLELHFPMVWVEGEISNLSKPSSGHWYFTLKDFGGQVKCAMFRGQNIYTKHKPQAGDKIKVRARVSLYEGRGDFQLIVEQLEPAGFGLLQQQFEQLKAKLLEEGLFSEEFKQGLPTIPQHIAVITSPSGAAVRDVLTVLRRRMPSIPVTILPCAVQGEDAPMQLIKAIKTADAHAEFDLILLCRGGGSIEDLWAFNSELLARAIYDCNKPVVSAVGHEVDFTIADFVADVRAATPSAAAELLSPDSHALLNTFAKLENQLQKEITSVLSMFTQQVLHAFQKLKHPRDKIQQWHQALDQCEYRLANNMDNRLQKAAVKLENLQHRMLKSSPQSRIADHKTSLNKTRLGLNRSISWSLKNIEQRLKLAAEMLNKVSPLSTMQRGYSVATNADGKVVQSVSEVELNQDLNVEFADGKIKTTVIEKFS